MCFISTAFGIEQPKQFQLKGQCKMMQDNMISFTQADFAEVKRKSNSMIDMRILMFVRNGISSLDEMATRLRTQPEKITNAISKELFEISGNTILIK